VWLLDASVVPFCNSPEGANGMGGPGQQAVGLMFSKRPQAPEDTPEIGNSLDRCSAVFSRSGRAASVPGCLR